MELSSSPNVRIDSLKRMQNEFFSCVEENLRTTQVSDDETTQAKLNKDKFKPYVAQKYKRY